MSDRPVLNIGRDDGRVPLVFGWGVSSFFGWGVYGLNLSLALANHPRYIPLSAVPFGPDDVALDPLRLRTIGRLALAADPIWKALGSLPQTEVGLDHPVLLAAGNDMEIGTGAHERALSGRPSIGVAFLEEAGLSVEGRARASRFALIVAGSSWNTQVLQAQGLPATTVLQGVDPVQFHPAPRSGLFPGRFVVFSGGKLEFRKGQDLVIAAFRAFRQRHAEALLVTAWHSPWSDLAAAAVGRADVVPPMAGADGAPDITGWAVANGIPADAVVAVGHVPNISMSFVMREADVALFPNRCEGGTNLVAMECLACGIPCILSANTGHLDLLRAGIALPLRRQSPVAADGIDTRDWGESDVEEMVEQLETVWRDRGAAVMLGARGAAHMAGMSWRHQADTLLRAIEPFFPAA